MYKVWAKKIKNNSVIASLNVKNNEQLSLEEKRDKCIKEICQKFDLSVPLWLKKHEEDFSQYKYVTFYPDDFVDDIDFERLEIDLIDDGMHKK